MRCWLPGASVGSGTDVPAGNNRMLPASNCCKHPGAEALEGEAPGVDVAGVAAVAVAHPQLPGAVGQLGRRVDRVRPDDVVGAVEAADALQPVERSVGGD